MRIHLVFSFYVLVFSLIADITETQMCLVLICMALVLCAELVNSSIERLADEAHPETSDRIKQTKDMAAGAVLICAIISALIGAGIFFRTAVINSVLCFIKENIWSGILLAASLPLCIWFAASLKVQKKKENGK